MNKKRLVVSQSNKLTEARYSLSVTEQRLVLTILSLISPTDDDFKEYSIRSAELKSLLGIRHHGIREQIKNALKQLSEKSITIQKPTGFLIANWFSSAEYLDDEGRVIITLDAKLKPYLIQLKEQFTQFNLHTVAHFRSTYTIRIYMLLKQYERIGHREFSVSELRDLLGIDKTVYKQFKDFNRRVIGQAKSDFEKKDDDGVYLSDIGFDLETIKAGRSVTRLRFNIRKHHIKVIEPDQTNHEDIINLFVGVGISKAKVVGWLKEFGEEYLKDKFTYAEHQKDEGKLRGSFSGFLVSAIKHDYKSDIKKQQEEQQQVTDKQREECHRLYLIVWMEKAKNELISSKIEALLNSLEPDELGKLKELVKKEFQEVGMKVAEDSKPFVGGLKLKVRQKIKHISEADIEAFRPQVTPPDLEEIEREYDQKTAKKMELYLDEFMKT